MLLFFFITLKYLYSKFHLVKKIICLVTFSLFLTVNATTQDFGYKTIDVGAEFLSSTKGHTATLHLAFNFPVHHAFLFRAGYNSSKWKATGKHDYEEGNGPGASLGYRYYFLVRPHGFFLGARADVWRLTINWQKPTVTGKSKIWALQPNAEMGYMFLINDMFFISPTISAGVQTNIKTEGEEVGNGFIPQFGLSAGWKF
jgi:hypothetical protein